MRALGDPAPHDTGWRGFFAPGKDATVPTYRPIPPSGTKPGWGPRPDGRRAEEMRPCHLQIGASLNSAGSAYIEQGQTKILVAVFGPRQPWGQVEAMNEGSINVEVQFAAFSSKKSAASRTARAKLYSSMLKGALESVVMLERYAKSVIDVHLLIVEDDGSCLSTALSAATLALSDAAIDMRDLVAGATVHLVKSLDGTGYTLLLDCDASEEAAMPEGSAVLHYGLCPTRGMVCLMHSVGSVPLESFEQMVLLAKDTAEAVGTEMRQCLEARATHRKAKRQKKGGASAGLSNGDLGGPGMMLA